MNNMNAEHEHPKSIDKSINSIINKLTKNNALLSDAITVEITNDDQFYIQLLYKDWKRLKSFQDSVMEFLDRHNAPEKIK